MSEEEDLSGIVDHTARLKSDLAKCRKAVVYEQERNANNVAMADRRIHQLGADNLVLATGKADLLEGLRKYGRHLDQCGILRIVCPAKDGLGKCLCSLDAILSNEIKCKGHPTGEKCYCFGEEREPCCGSG